MTSMNMKDLAELAGLDISTVSRALRGDSKRVAPSTMQRVQELAREHGFVIDPVAASLRSGRSRMLGVLVNTLTDIVMGHLVTAIDQASQEMGYLSVVVETRGTPGDRAQAIDRLLSRRVDGFILCEALVGSEVPSTLLSSGVPFVFAMRGSDAGISVTADDYKGGTLVARHFIDMGHDSVAIIEGPSNTRTSVDRTAGFSDTIAKARGVRLLRSVGVAGYGVEDGYRAAVRYLRRQSIPTAICCVNDHAAIGAGRAIVEAGLRIGKDVALVGYNDIPQAQYLETPLSSVRTDVGLMGRTAAQQLVALVNGEIASSSQTFPTLVVRASSAP
jgi:LacI family transcriptional regulator